MKPGDTLNMNLKLNEVNTTQFKLCLVPDPEQLSGNSKITYYENTDNKPVLRAHQSKAGDYILTTRFIGNFTLVLLEIIINSIHRTWFKYQLKV